MGWQNIGAQYWGGNSEELQILVWMGVTLHGDLDLCNYRYRYRSIGIEVENRHMHFGALFSHIEAK